MTYLYRIVGTDQTLEVEQRISEAAHKVLEIDGEFKQVERLINNEGHFALIGGGWAGDGYAKPEAARYASAALGKNVERKK